MSLLQKYIKTLDKFDSIIPPKLAGVEVNRLDYLNGTIEIRPYMYRAMISNGEIYHYPPDINEMLRQSKCPGINDTLVWKLGENMSWHDECTSVFEMVSQKIYMSHPQTFFFSLNEVSDYYGGIPSNKITAPKYYSFVLQQELFGVYDPRIIDLEDETDSIKFNEFNNMAKFGSKDYPWTFGGLKKIGKQINNFIKTTKGDSTLFNEQVTQTKSNIIRKRKIVTEANLEKILEDLAVAYI